jgi:hypothetical protein
MASTDGMDFPEIDPNQLGKAATHNEGLLSIEQAMGGELLIQADDGSHASPYTIRYDTADEPVGVKTALRFFVMVVSGALTADWTAYLPAGKVKPFVVINNTTGGHNVIVMVSGKTGVTVPSLGTFFCYLNGTDVQQLAINLGANTNPWDVGNFIDGQPTVGQVVMRWVATRTITFPADFSSNKMQAGSAAAGTAVWNVNKNGTNVGAATFLGAGTVPTWTSVGHAPVIFSSGDVGTFIAPNPQDASLADLVWTFSGTR